MPSPMIHLLTAYIYAPASSGLFFMGCFMPDFTNDRDKKDSIHLRNVENKWESLAQVAVACDPNDSFREGWLFHLFTDSCWDESILQEYIANSELNNWFMPYREQTKLATYWLFHNLEWSQNIWERINNASLENVNIENGPTIVEMDWYRKGVFEKHKDNNTEASTAFPPSLLYTFAKETSERYIKWRSTNSYRCAK